MSPTKLSLVSLTINLSQIAMAISNRSDKVSDRSCIEARKWIDEVKSEKFPKYIRQCITQVQSTLARKNTYEKA
ncbi:MAG: hypothetical protein ABI758_05780, partial [Candidatus Woesebacteria bacterium]